MTTTDLDVRQDATAVPTTGSAFAPTPTEAVTTALEQWVGGMAASVRGAEFIVDTPMCPDAFWPLPANTKSKTPKQMLPQEDRESYLARRKVAAYTLGAVVRYGLQLGLPPEVAVQGIFTIGGRMSMYAEQMVALIKSKGHGHRVIERTRGRCTVEVRRAGSQEWVSFTFTFEDAVAAGYVPHQGPNENPGVWADSGKPKESGGNAKYLTDPAAMLYARASSIACRTEFPDVLRGLVSYEEVLDERRAEPVAVEVVDVQPTRATAAAVLAAAAPAPAPVAQPAPALAAEPQPPAAEPVERYILPISKGKLDLIKEAFERLGYGGRAAAVRDQRMAVLSSILARTITDPRELTADEGTLVLDNLAGEAGTRVVAAALGLDVPAPAPVDEAPAETLADPHDGQDAWAPQP